MSRLYYILLLCLLCGCSKEKALKKAKFWKFADGDYVQDIIIFDENYSLKNDTIYYFEKPEYLLLDYNNNLLFGPEEIRIQPIRTNFKSRFVAK